jgi:hypothetical protein
VTLAAEKMRVGQGQGFAVGEAQTRAVLGLVAAPTTQVSVFDRDAAVEILGYLGLARQGVGVMGVVAGRASDAHGRTARIA